jgi:hypothetical protein
MDGLGSTSTLTQGISWDPVAWRPISYSASTSAPISPALSPFQASPPEISELELEFLSKEIDDSRELG